MIKFGEKVVKFRIPIIIISILLLIPSFFGCINTKINYDLLSYLPKEIETMKGQDILVDEFGTGAMSFLIVEDTDMKEVAKIKEQVEQVEHVENVFWYDSLADISVPKEMLPTEVKEAFDSNNLTMMTIVFDDTSSAESTVEANKNIRTLLDNNSYLSGSVLEEIDTRALSDEETPIYILIAVLLSCLVLSLTMDSFFAPILFMISIGISVLYNLGSNIILGEISYITSSLAAVLQLGVTMDFAIFLWHIYEEEKERFAGDKEKAMAHAISSTISSVVGSSVTTIAGFLALCFMSFAVGMDLGIVMAKGVVFGVITCVTTLPSMILLFDKVIEKSKHKVIMPEFKGISEFIVKHYKIFALIFIVVMIPAAYGNSKTPVYYNIADKMPATLKSAIAKKKLEENYNPTLTHMALINSSLDKKQVSSMIKEMEAVDGVDEVLGLAKIFGPVIPDNLIPDDVKKEFKNDKYEILLINTQYKIATDEVNNQCTELNKIIKNYDSEGILAGEAPCTKDLITITAQDFKTVSLVSIGVIFFIIALVFQSVSIPIVLVLVIQLAIFINMGLPYYLNTPLPFIASIVIGTIQLGATVDYAILMTTRYKKERTSGRTKQEAVIIAHRTSIKSVIGSALCFFAATCGVGLYSSDNLVGSLCSLMARGAVISMFVVIFILPAMYMVFDKIICATSVGFKCKNSNSDNRVVN